MYQAIKKSAIVLLLVLVVAINGCSFTPGVEYVCLPCGGIYSCTGTNTCVQNSLSGCSLPATATYWLCCVESICDARGDNMCSYTEPLPPPPPPPPPPSGNNNNDDDGTAAWKIWLAVLVTILFLTFIAGIVAFVISALIKKKNSSTVNPVLNQTTYGSQSF